MGAPLLFHKAVGGLAVNVVRVTQKYIQPLLVVAVAVTVSDVGGAHCGGMWSGCSCARGRKSDNDTCMAVDKKKKIQGKKSMASAVCRIL